MTWARLGGAVRRGAAGLVAVFVVAALVQQWGRMRPHLGELGFGAVSLALVAVAGSVFASMLAWRAVLADLGSPLPLAAAVRIFFLGQLGKYLPGSVWPVVTQMELGKRYAVPRVRSATAAVVAIAVGILSGILAAAVTLPLTAGEAARGYLWLLAAVPVLLVPLHPRVLTPLLDRALALVRRPPLEHALGRRGILGCVGWSLVMWVGFGVQVWLLALDLGGGGGRLLPLSVGAFAVAWTAGFLFVVAPAGAGVREAGLVVLLAGVLGAPAATLLAVCSRLLLTLGDLVWAAVALVSGRRPV